MSPRRSTEPSGLLRSTIAANCSGVCRRSCALIVAFNCWPGTAGAPPSWPMVTCAFCARIAAITSVTASP